MSELKKRSQSSGRQDRRKHIGGIILWHIAPASGPENKHNQSQSGFDRMGESFAHGVSMVSKGVRAS